MVKKDLFRIASKLAMILLLPLLPTLISVGYKLIIIPSLPSMQMQQVFRIIICGIPISLIIAYGYITRDKITSTLSGAFLFPLFTIYYGIFCALADHYFTVEWLIGRLRWQLTPPSFAPFMLDVFVGYFFMLVPGLAGYFASRRTKVSLLIAILFAILFSLFVLGID